MVFSSNIFLFLFLPLYLITYYSTKDIKIKNLVLLLFSLFFYAWGEPYYVLLMIFSIIINFYLTKVMAKNNSKFILILLIIINIGLLLSFKYTNFFIDNINNLFKLNISNIKLTLPIGISFYTFQILSYVFDVYQKKVKVQNNIYKLACYITAFPQLIAGPIVRYSDIEKQLNERKTTVEDFTSGVRRFIVGLSKKVLIANLMAFVADSIYNYDLISTGFIGMLIASISYALQIYFDFSGYSDMAIGLGKMSGFTFMENFNYPYIAKSITDFWRRWHISLSSFFKDYVYIPLGGSRKGTFKTIRNILIVWLLTGFWHGACWNFVLWGLYYALFLLIEKFLLKEKFKNNFIYRIITLLIISIGWIIFRQTDFNQLLIALKALFGFYGIGNISSLYYLGIFSSRYIIAFIIGILGSTKLIKHLLSKENIITDIILLILFILCIIFITVGSYNPFIYYRF